MTQQPKRIPGERNPTPNADATMHPVNEAHMANGQGTHGTSIVRGVVALVGWLKRRKARKGRNG